MSDGTIALVAVVAAYLLGTFPTALVVGQRTGHDPTRRGLGQPWSDQRLPHVGMGRRPGRAVRRPAAKGRCAAGVGLADRRPRTRRRLRRGGGRRPRRSVHPAGAGRQGRGHRRGDARSSSSRWSRWCSSWSSPSSRLGGSGSVASSLVMASCRSGLGSRGRPLGGARHGRGGGAGRRRHHENIERLVRRDELRVLERAHGTRRSSRRPASGPASSRPPRPSPRRCCRWSTGRPSSTWSRRRFRAGIDDILIITGGRRARWRTTSTATSSSRTSSSRRASWTQLEESGSWPTWPTSTTFARTSLWASAMPSARPVSTSATNPSSSLLRDDVMVDDGELLRRMMAIHEEHGGVVLALLRGPPRGDLAYGSRAVEPRSASGVMRVDDIVEKPAPEDAPSDLAVIGRYVLTTEIFAAIDRGPRGGRRDPAHRRHRRPDRQGPGPRLRLTTRVATTWDRRTTTCGRPSRSPSLGGPRPRFRGFLADLVEARGAVIPLEEARAHVLARCSPSTRSPVPVADSLGWCLPSRSRPPRRCHRSTTRRWTGSRAGRRHRRCERGPPGADVVGTLAAGARPPTSSGVGRGRADHDRRRPSPPAPTV